MFKPHDVSQGIDRWGVLGGGDEWHGFSRPLKTFDKKYKRKAKPFAFVACSAYTHSRSHLHPAICFNKKTGLFYCAADHFFMPFITDQTQAMMSKHDPTTMGK